MKKLFSIILGLVCAAGLVFTVSGCDNGNEENETTDGITNTMTIRGANLEIDFAIYFGDEKVTNIDVDTKGEMEKLHGHGYFDSAWIGKTTDLQGEFFLSFNPMTGSSIDPEIKSGTIKINKVEKGLHIIVDAVETSGEAFKMNFLAEDEESFNARQ